MGENSKYMLGIIGLLGRGPDNGIVFVFNKEEYHLVFDCSIKSLLRDVKKLNEYSLEKIVQDEETYLALYLTTKTPFYYPTIDQLPARKRIVDLFFTIPEEDSEMIPIEEAEANSRVDNKHVQEFDKIYEKLRDRHIGEKLSDKVPASVQHLSLVPKLRNYQFEAIRWMIHRELEQEYIPNICQKVIANAVKGQEFFFNWRTCEINDSNPGNIELPFGGILADEMGLGKTVEILALLLNHRFISNEEINTSPLKTKPLPKKEVLSSNLKCICRKSAIKNLIECNNCQKFQHRKCVKKNRNANSKENDGNYICPQCWQNSEIINSKGTLIVTPTSIKKQWELEISKHICDNDFKVLIYEGIPKLGWISPLDLCEYDVVITDYNILKYELNFTNFNSKEESLRHKRKHMNPTSPLPLLKWWRVCLDEAQMVETSTNKSAQMVQTIPAVYRWAVTGTPIEKSIHNLYGLLYFLGCEPYTDFKCWTKLVEPFLQNGNPDSLVDVLKKVMWRTCKKYVIDQIGIPPQTRICHYVVMSDLQMIFYKDRHECCRLAFLEKARKLISDTSNTMNKWNPHILKLLLDPLRKLRQDCTVPSIRQKGTDQNMTKKLLSPDELYSHLLTNNEMECKAQLRTIVSSLNGLAGIALLKDDFELAVKLYKSVLVRAKESTGTITVDSLLQIHALHNLIKAITIFKLDETDVVEYWRKLNALEGKYIESYYSVMKSAENQLLLISTTIVEEDPSTLGNWWRFYFLTFRGTAKEEPLIERIHSEIKFTQVFVNFSGDLPRTFPGYDLFLTAWLDKVVKHRKRVLEAFDELKFFTEKIGSNYEQSEEERKKILLFISSVSECHLDVLKSTPDPEDEEEDYEPVAKIDRKTKCQMCNVKEILMEYETKIFDKAFNLETDEEKGTWKPSFQEWIIRILYQTLKKEPNFVEAIEEAEAFLQLLDKYKNEYKELSKYWVEINYTASAFDELNMCKLQIEAIDPKSLKKSEKMKRNQISIFEIEMTKIEFSTQLNEAELEFQRIKRTLNYLHHLSENPILQSCPICNLKPEDKYSVWECGHQFCISCVIQMKKYHGVNLNCPVCRSTQKFNDINFVTLKKETEIGIQGNYSEKILKIVHEVQVLRKEDSNVKIIIFSQWIDILKVIEKALQNNRVNCLLRMHKFHEVVEQFKSATSGITCLLLPLTYGSKGLNLVEATHVFLVEPILNPSEEMQAIGRIHRIGQTKPTFVHKFIVKNTIEETIHNTVTNDVSGKWQCKNITVNNLKELFNLNM